jgi:predicted PurR-regulated permease PerM
MFGIDVRALRAAWTVVLLGAALAIAYFARETLFIVILAVFLAYLLLPPVHLLRKYAPRISRPVAVAAVFVALVVAVAAGSVSIGERVTEQAVALGQRLPELLKDPNLTDRIPLPKQLEPLRARIVDTVRGQFQSDEKRGASVAQQFALHVVHTAGNLLYVVVIPILGFLLLKDGERLRRGFLALMPARRRPMADALLGDLNTLLARYVRALLLLSLATFFAYALAMSLMDVPYALVIAAVAGPLEFIPVLGPLTAAGVAVLVAAFSGYEHLAWIAAFLLAYRVFQDYALSPYLMSEGIEIHPVIVIVGILAGEQVGGVPGMFLAIPLIAAGKIVVERLTAAPRNAVHDT